MGKFTIDRRYYGFRYPSVRSVCHRTPPEYARYSLGYYRGKKRVVFDYFQVKEHAIRCYDALKERYPDLKFDILPVIF